MAETAPLGPNHIAELLLVPQKDGDWPLFQKATLGSTWNGEFSDTSDLQQTIAAALWMILSIDGLSVAVVSSNPELVERWKRTMSAMFNKAILLGDASVSARAAALLRHLDFAPPALAQSRDHRRRIIGVSDIGHTVDLWGANEILLIDLTPDDDSLAAHELYAQVEALRVPVRATFRLWSNAR